MACEQGRKSPLSRAEQTDDGDVLLGIMFGEHQEGVCQLEEVELVNFSV